MKIAASTSKLLKRPLTGVVSLNDVFKKNAIIEKSKFWELTDPDAAITEWHGNRPYSALNMQIHLDPRLGIGGYLSVLVDDLVYETAERLDSSSDKAYLSHPDTVAEIERAKSAQAIIINSAPRSATTTEDGARNGRSFFLAITENGVEIYATPVDQLRALDKRHRIIALYEIANENNPAYKNSEQFRSRLISRVRRHPDCLTPIYEYKDRESLLKAKRSGAHPDVISHADDFDKVEYVDRFGNIRLEFQDAETLRKTLSDSNVGKMARVEVGSGARRASFKATIANSMREAPHEEFAIYTNKSDPVDETGGLKTPIYAELIIQGDVTNSHYISAAQVVQQKYAKFLGAPVKITIL